MFGFGKKSPQVTFKEHVTEFWQWYPTVAERFFHVVEEGQCGSLTEEFGDGAIFPEGKQSDVRANIEDAIHDALQQQQSGRTLGGAWGLRESYIDLLLVDGDNSRAIVEQCLAELQLQGRSRVESFL